MQYRFEGLLSGRLAVDLVRDVIMIGWDLHSDLTAWQQSLIKTRDQLFMILRPMQGGVAEDEIPFAGQMSLIALFEVQRRACMGDRLFEHLCGGVEPDNLDGVESVLNIERPLVRSYVLFINYM